LRWVFSALLVVLLSAPVARAAEPRCFGPEAAWCAWTVDPARIEAGWRVAYRTDTEGGPIEAVIDSPGNRPRLGVRLLSAGEDARAQVIISLRPDDRRPDQWRQYVGRHREMDDGAMRFSLGRRALESVLQAPASATLFVFVELRSPTSPVKASQKIPLRGLNEALRFARLGR
jgi:hypothetical protein